MDTKEVHKIVNSIKANLFKNANSFSIGMLKSHFKGVGLKFKEHQLYAHGDDVRFIDWKMLAKTNQPYIKTFEEDRNVEITVLFDCTEGMFLGAKGKSKIEAAMEITCLLYLLAGMTKDYVHTIICTGEKVIRVQKKNGEAGIIAFVNALKNEGIIRSDGKVNNDYIVKDVNADDYVKQIIREFYKKRELVILSDFYDFPTGDNLKKLLIRKHVHAFRLLTPLDYADQFKYTLKGRSRDRAGVVDIQTMTKSLKDVDSRLRVKDLRLEDRYLEEFVKEML